MPDFFFLEIISQENTGKSGAAVTTVLLCLIYMDKSSKSMTAAPHVRNCSIGIKKTSLVCWFSFPKIYSLKKSQINPKNSLNLQLYVVVYLQDDLSHISFHNFTTSFSTRKQFTWCVLKFSQTIPYLTNFRLFLTFYVPGKQTNLKNFLLK